ncbi:cyclin-dependent kinase inhibitor 3 family protein [Pseudomonas sp. LA21]|uniref:cyclin-dependent kinase inhibitor 3 family protein n=1 Tax=Pseudomonas sp. LA21 TaxID=2893373 RepID=UPI001FB65D44|nr:cyclin-dependent kinase inhibitor 3 family protein [Pseudomonas sp. LA21]MCJ1888240.1 cyclin-dependent kinase inhibitor 3 family protein [Pseudomonas sp. LA21]
MTHPFDVLSVLNLPGKLIFTPCPGTKETSLDEALQTLKQAGADAVITLMPLSELNANGIDRIAEHCEQIGLTWFHLPVADEQVPQSDFDQSWDGWKQQILDLLMSGKVLAIHCKGGSGRTGLIAARILIEAGVARTDAVAQVKALRPKAIQHPAHVNWISQFDVGH